MGLHAFTCRRLGKVGRHDRVKDTLTQAYRRAARDRFAVIPEVDMQVYGIPTTNQNPGTAFRADFVIQPLGKPVSTCSIADVTVVQPSAPNPHLPGHPPPPGDAANKAAERKVAHYTTNVVMQASRVLPVVFETTGRAH